MMNSSMSASAQEYVDLERYPIADSGGAAYRDLVERCRLDMAQHGACVLHNFIPEARVRALVKATQSVSELAHHNVNDTTTPYQETVLPGDAGSHPRRSPRRSSVHVLAYDLIQAEHGIRLLYEWDVLLLFLADVLDVDQLYRYEDRLAALNIAVNRPGDENGWHFDQCDFVCSILIRAADRGGEFLYVPNVRDQHDENYNSVATVLDGTHDGIVRLAMEPGSLVLFKGRDSIHRVTPIEGKTARLIALLGYDTTPGVLMSENARLRRFGRLA